MTAINYDCPFNIEHRDHTSVEKFQSRKWPWSKFSKSSDALPPSVSKKPPPIPFVSKVKKMDKVDGSDADKYEWIKLKFLMYPDNPASKYPQQFAMDTQRSGSSGLWHSVTLRT
jgi:hypothetical protein